MIYRYECFGHLQIKSILWKRLDVLLINTRPNNKHERQILDILKFLYLLNLRRFGQPCSN